MQPDGMQPDGMQPSYVSPEGAAIYVTRRFRVVDAAWWQQRASTHECDYFRVQPAHPGVDPSEQDRVSIDLFDMCASFWLPNEAVVENEYVRPSRATGFSYQWTGSDGNTGFREPRWPTVIGQTVSDGSGLWTCAAASTNAINAISNVTAVSEPLGLTIAAADVQESTRIVATYSGGDAGNEYAAVFSFTLDGYPRVVRHRVPVRKR
jgi:hypothetical protein